MRELAYFSGNVAAQFGNNYSNMLQFNGLMLDAARNVFGRYSKDDAGSIIRNQFDRIFGAKFRDLSPMKQRQAWREHGKEIASLIEDVILDRMTSGWNEGNARFLSLVEEVNIADGDKNEFFVEDNSLLQVSRFAGDHHDIVRQHVKPGVAFSIETSAYSIKVYADFREMQLGKIDFAAMVDRMYRSIASNRLDALYTAFMSMDESLPTDMILETPVSEATKDAIIEHAEFVKSVTGYDVMFVGPRVAIQKLQGTVGYNMFSNDMKNERYENGILANWEGYECLPLSRVNKAGTRVNALDNSKIYIIPVDPEFKPLKKVNEGDVVYFESGMSGERRDKTVDVEITYWEGIGVVVNELFGEIKIQTA